MKKVHFSSCTAAKVLGSLLVISALASCSDADVTAVKESEITAASSRATSTYRELKGDSGSISFTTQYNNMYTIDGTKVKNGWNFAYVDLSAYNGQTVTIEFGASMQADNKGNGATLNWNVNDSAYTVVASTDIPRGSSSWRWVSGSKTVKLGSSNSMLYLSSYSLRPSDFKINVSNISIKVSSSSGGNSGGYAPAPAATYNATNMQKKLSASDVKGTANNNPISATKFTADPAVLVYGDTVYVYGTNDSQQAEYTNGSTDNAFDRINSLNIYSSKDLVNWTYNGVASVAGSSWAKNTWAPAVCTKKINGKDKFFLYFADSARGIGVLTSDSPTGPFVDPIGRALITKSMPNMGGVYWLFDPAVLNDTDGRSYLYFGGGVGNNPAHPKSARVIELGSDMISVKGTAKEIDAPWLFEDSGINKFGDTYYYSYCTNWNSRGSDRNAPPIASIAYMTSKSPMGPFTYRGYTLRNPNNGNDHHWIFSFKGKNYIAYHTQKVSETIGVKGGGYRNVCLNDFRINPDGSLPIQTTNLSGVAQVTKFNPYVTVAGSTMHSSKNVVSLDDSSIVAVGNDSYICIKGADLGKGITKFTAKLASKSSSGSVSVYVDSLSSSPVVSVSTNGKTSVSASANKGAMSGQHNIYIRISGDARISNWKFN